MVGFSYYPTWTPDLHLEIPASGQTPAKHYFVDVWDDTKPFFVSVRKMRNYVNFMESSDWQEDEPLPTILAICEDERSQKRLNRQMKRILDEQWDEELIFATTTRQRLMEATKATDRIWLRVEVDGEPQSATLSVLRGDI